jgi:hypothetical protein
MMDGIIRGKQGVQKKDAFCAPLARRIDPRPASDLRLVEAEKENGPSLSEFAPIVCPEPVLVK